MSSLFGLAGEYKQLYAMLTDADEDEKQTVEDTLEAVKGEIQVKASGYLAKTVSVLAWRIFCRSVMPAQSNIFLALLAASSMEPPP